MHFNPQNSSIVNQPAEENPFLPISQMKALEKVMLEAIPFRKSPGSRSFECVLCSSSVSAYTSGYSLRFHMKCKHPEYYLKSLKNSQVTAEQFQHLCQKLLSNLMLMGLKSMNNGRLFYECFYCEQRKVSKVSITCHLLSKHYMHLGKELLKLQVDPTLLVEPEEPMVIKEFEETPGKGKQQIKCDFCKAEYYSKKCLVTHRRRCHWDKISGEKNLTCFRCKKWFPHGEKFKRHMQKGTCKAAEKAKDIELVAEEQMDQGFARGMEDKGKEKGIGEVEKQRVNENRGEILEMVSGDSLGFEAEEIVEDEKIETESCFDRSE